MELTNTLLIRFALVSQIIFDSYFFISNIFKLNIGVVANLFYKFKPFISFKIFINNPC